MHSYNNPVSRLSIFLICILCFLNKSAFAKNDNHCGVEASFTPISTDSVVPLNTMIPLRSTSKNATSIEWIVNGFRTGNSSPGWNYFITTGIHVISLVARNGDCTDTTTAYYFSSGEPHSVDTMLVANYGMVNYHEFGTAIDDTPDGGYFLGGYGIDKDQREYGYVIKLKDKGCIDWSRKFSYLGYRVNSVYAATDGSLYVIMNPFIIKLDVNGNMLWKQDFLSPEHNGLITYMQLAGDADGNLYALNRAENGYLITKLNGAGNILWSKIYRFGTDNQKFASPGGIYIRENKIYVSGNFIENGKASNFLHCISTLDAKSYWQYGYSAINGHANFWKIAGFGDNLMVSGGSGTDAMVAIINNQGVIQKGIKAGFGRKSTPDVIEAEADDKGNINIMIRSTEYLHLQPYYAYNTQFLKIDSSLNKHLGLYYENYPRGYFADAALNKDGSWAAVGEDWGKVTDGMIGSRDFRFIEIDSFVQRGDLNCNWNSNDFDVSVLNFETKPFNWTSESSFNLVTRPARFSADEVFTQSRYACPDFIDSCSFMRISGPKQLCNLQSTYTYEIHRNKACALTPQWQFPEGVTIVSQTTHSITLRFPKFGEYKVAAVLNSCMPVKDSFTVRIAPPQAILNLGVDTSICANTSIQLNASLKFVSYRWQDNSTNSIFTVNSPGLYWVEVADACGNIFKDSIVITAFSKLKIDAGQDRIKCNSDTVYLSAPGGFANYVWTTADGSTLSNTSRTIVNPVVTTTYFLQAEKLPGCFAYDTLQVVVHHSTSINLGNDTTLCAGDSLFLDAGDGFRSYQWDAQAGRQISSSIMARTKGAYSIQAWDKNGCLSKDTLWIREVFTLPSISLNKNSILCSGESRTLSAGNGFTSYQWNTGLTTPSIIINKLGIYKVQVIDGHGCKVEDSVSITKIQPRPSAFLMQDAQICAYESLTLKTNVSFNHYLWSNSTTTPQLIVTGAGLYWLEVTDANNCQGRDSVQVTIKLDCISGFHVPNAFTPNKDGKNDLFKPLIFGNLKQYQFTVYNRWGEVVFRSSEAAKGWDGKLSGNQQDSNVFIWSCVYQLEGGDVKSEKGTVMLLR